ncbi:MAG: hypothetical protein IBX64_03365 [Actinobacteria bacterium]|nr:hypothetical protein [Actinomycetota bacterium]
MKKDSSIVKNGEISGYIQARIRLFLITYRWASFLFALSLLLMQKGTYWWIIIIAVAYNISITVCLELVKDGYESNSLLLFDLIACIFFTISGGHIITDPALNPFFLYSFTPLLGIAFSNQLRDSFLAALLLSLKLFFCSG